MFDDIGERLAQHRCHVVQQGPVEHAGDRAVQADDRFESEGGHGRGHDGAELGPGLVDARRLLELEDRGPDLADRLVQVLDGAPEHLADRQVLGALAHGLEGEAGREDPLDDVVVQVSGDPVAVLEHGHALLVRATVGELERHGRVRRQLLGHLDVGRAEGWPPAPPRDDDGPAHSGLAHERTRHGRTRPVRAHGPSR